jgi:hypothetical protein
MAADGGGLPNGVKRGPKLSPSAPRPIIVCRGDHAPKALDFSVSAER